MTCKTAVLILCATLGATVQAQKLATLDGVTFADTGRKRVYFPIREVATNMGWELSGPFASLKLNGHRIPTDRQRYMPNGVRVLDVVWLKHAGALVNRNMKTGILTVKSQANPGKAFYVRTGMKRVFINKKTQSLIAFQGQRTVMRTQVSTGRKGKESPLGIFEAKGKEKMHLSRLYNDFPMPWAIHVVGNVFVHGYNVTALNASHGCIRLPMKGFNPAKWFYYWTDVGTPITISGKWPSGVR